MLEDIQYRFLCNFWPLDPSVQQTQGAQKLDNFIKPLDPFLSGLDGLDVLDFGCGNGHESLALAKSARSVFGVDINPKWIEGCKQRAEAAGVRNVEFTTKLEPGRQFDAVITLDAFEHFEDPQAILDAMYEALKPGGLLLASFGPTWYHPYGGHLFSAFPWAHILFTEKALIRWRNRFRETKATRLKEGMNGWPIVRFERMVRKSRFVVEQFKCVPISAAKRIHCRATREITTTVVQMKLRKPGSITQPVTRRHIANCRSNRKHRGFWTKRLIWTAMLENGAPGRS